MGIEPTSSAWKAEVLPLNYTRLVKAVALQASRAVTAFHYWTHQPWTHQPVTAMEPAVDLTRHVPRTAFCVIKIPLSQ